MELKIEYLSVNNLTPYENNAKKHGDEDIEYIKNSIEEFGMNDPIGIWSDKNIIVEGHGRLLACKSLGLQKVPCIRLDNLTDEQRKAYALAHNKTAEMSAWDFGLLDKELAGLEDFNMEDFGFEFVEDEFGTDFELPNDGKSEFCQMAFTLHEKQKELIEKAIEEVKDKIIEDYGNTNKNGNALYEVVREWEMLKK